VFAVFVSEGLFGKMEGVVLFIFDRYVFILLSTFGTSRGSRETSSFFFR